MMEELKEKLSLQLESIRANRNVIELENKYFSLPDRDRLFVNILAACIALFLLWRILISPALSYITTGSQSYQKQLDDYEFVSSALLQIKEANVGSDGVERSGSLLSIASSSAKNYNLSFKSFEPIGDDKLRLRLEQIQFNDIVKWLGFMESEQGVSAIDISMDSAASGYVNARITLQDSL